MDKAVRNEKPPAKKPVDKTKGKFSMLTHRSPDTYSGPGL